MLRGLERTCNIYIKQQKWRGVGSKADQLKWNKGTCPPQYVINSSLS